MEIIENTMVMEESEKELEVQDTPGKIIPPQNRIWSALIWDRAFDWNKDAIFYNLFYQNREGFLKAQGEIMMKGWIVFITISTTEIL